MLRVNQLIGFGAGGNKVTRELTASAVSSADQTNYTFSSQSLGAETADRFMVVAATITGNAVGRTIDSVTVGGVSATQAIQTIAGGGAAEIWYTPKVADSGPTGSTGDVVVNTSGSCLNCSVAVYAVKSASSVTPTAAQNDTSSPLSLSINVPANGVGIAVARAAGTPGDTTWAGFIEDTDQALDGGIGVGTTASAEFSAEQVGLTVSASWGAGTANTLSAAAWGP